MEYLYTLAELDQVAVSLLKQYNHYPVWAFYAPMGAGKTTLISAICKQLGVKDHVTSPTFSLMNEYIAGTKMVIHMDWYRMEDEVEASRAGLAAAIDQADYCFIEWPEKAPGILPSDTLHLGIDILSPEQRRIFTI